MTEDYEDPYEKYDDFEERFHKKGGGGGGGQKVRDPHSKTSKAARRASIEHATSNRSEEAFDRIIPVVDNLMKGLSERAAVDVAKEYVDWINWCITTRELQLDFKRDVEQETTRGSGPGGQNVNKVSSAVRLIHKLTGIDAESSEERDQPVNRQKAYDKLQERLAGHLADWLTVLKDGDPKAKPRTLEISDIV